MQADIGRSARSAGARTGLPALVRVVGVAVLVCGGLAGCSAASPDVKLSVPSVMYVSRESADIGSSVNDLRLREKFTGWSSGDFTFTLDARDIEGKAVVKTALDNCPVRMPVFHCTQKAGSGGGLQNFHLVPAPGSRPGDSGTVRYRVTAPGTPAVTGRTTVVIGRPALKVEGLAPREDVPVGARTGVPVVIRNTGEVPARGVTFRMRLRDGLAIAGEHHNCRYSGADVWCRLPKVVIEPGQTYRLTSPEQIRVTSEAMYPEVGYSVAAFGTDYIPPPEFASKFRAGKGPDLELAAVERGKTGKTGKAGKSYASLSLRVDNHSDLEALGATVRGPVGSRDRIRIGVRNNGPGLLGNHPVEVGFTVPAGTTVVESPYEFERDEELIDQDCRALAADGTPLVAEPSGKQPSARRYSCTAKGPGRTTFGFTLRIDADIAHRGGRVTVRSADARFPAHDGKSANDRADVRVQVWIGPGWATLPVWITAGGGAAALLAVVLVRHRRRRSGRRTSV